MTNTTTLTDSSRAEINAIVSAHIRRYLKGVVIAYVFLLVGLGFALHENNSNAAATQRLAQQSATTRISTVKQRCTLTQIILSGVKIKSGGIANELQKSYAKCRAQLVEVEAIAKSGGK